jgi:acyl carrier protein
MNDVHLRLNKCFSAVFPELTTEEIVKATSDGTNNWDSLSWVTFLAVAQEEFEIEFDADTIESCTSFRGYPGASNGSGPQHDSGRVCEGIATTSGNRRLAEKLAND